MTSFKFSKNELSDTTVALACALAFGGVSGCIILFGLIGAANKSFAASIAVRLAIIGLLIVPILMRRIRRPDSITVLFYIWGGIYLLKVLFEVIAPSQVYFQEPGEKGIYFLVFVALPFLLLSCYKPKDPDKAAKHIFWFIVASCGVFGVLSTFGLREYIGHAGRITQMRSAGAEYVSPLTLAYVSALSLVLATWGLLNGPSARARAVLWSVIIFSLAPFILGASRGAVLSLAACFVLLLAQKRGAKKAVIASLAVAATGIGLYALNNAVGGEAFVRLFSISDDIDRGASSAIRLGVWEEALGIALQKPFWGGGLEVPSVGMHPHNIIVEAFMALGIFGGALLVFLLLRLALLGKSPILNNSALGWVPLVLAWATVQHMFSGAVYGASWLAVGSALVIVFSRSCKKKKT